MVAMDHVPGLDFDLVSSVPRFCCWCVVGAVGAGGVVGGVLCDSG